MTTPTDSATDDGNQQPDNEQLFTREYVQELRHESGKYRIRNKELEDKANKYDAAVAELGMMKAAQAITDAAVEQGANPRLVVPSGTLIAR